MSLTMPEEILLLMLDDDTGRLHDSAAPAGDYALAGAILAELALEQRIDTDPPRLRLRDASPTGDDVLDDVLARIQAEPKPRDSRWWLDLLVRDIERYRNAYFDRLVRKGVLRAEEGRFLWIFAERRYPVISDKEEREVKARLMSVIFEDGPPSPRDSLLIGLTRAAGLFPLLLAPGELQHAQARIEAVSRHEALNETISDAVRDIFKEIARYSPVV
ncbi:GOLPH3/VPS74 family protein [Roseomonas marmotae]|uniref:GPP34 family phosphoprotein n=1 Tax=Roseomonas marmotae TaxID=2768161 RepID=A0ABS3K962_9PROT|nr:GPP34 family phosphoprotein [Roseomonas marmotae]MBO1073980.1 GPP34 family phosphoprotein [Roseomonas marmotae]QTI78772.1 GPP34 family phosphoprotein [Roseomonas marmotae]